MQVLQQFWTQKTKPTLAKIRRESKKPLCHIVEYSNKRRSFQNDKPKVVVVSGTPRSGTTWVAEMFLNLSNTEVFWEIVPRVAKSPLRGFQLDMRPYIPHNTQWTEAEQWFDLLWSGKIIETNFFRKWDLPHLNPNYRLFKFIRISRLLPWIARRWPHLHILHLIRHPCAVVSSQLRYPTGDWRKADRFNLNFESLTYNKQYLRPYLNFLKKLQTPEEVLAALWSLDHLPVINDPERHSLWNTVSYERLVYGGLDSIHKIFTMCDLPIPKSVDETWTRPSSSTVTGSPILQGGSQLEGWKCHLSEEQISRIMHVVRYFELDSLYSLNSSFANCEEDSLFN